MTRLLNTSILFSCPSTFTNLSSLFLSLSLSLSLSLPFLPPVSASLHLVTTTTLPSCQIARWLIHLPALAYLRLRIDKRRQVVIASAKGPTQHTPTTHPRPQYNCYNIADSSCYNVVITRHQNVVNHSPGIPNVSRASFAIPRISRQTTQDAACLASSNFSHCCADQLASRPGFIAPFIAIDYPLLP